MKVYKNADEQGIDRIDFCCGKMGEYVISGIIKPKPWTDHPVYFWLGETRLNNCPFCGAVLDGDYYPPAEVTAVRYPHQDCFYSGGCGCDNHRLSVKPKGK